MKKALFIVNSIKKGGAERVCINLAEGLIDKGYSVDFISLAPIENNVAGSEKINYYSLNYKLDKRNEKIKCILFGHKKINRIVKNETYSLITSHLPLANIVTKRSVLGDKSIYVMHNTLDALKKSNRMLFGILYRNKKIVCVSKGIEAQIKSMHDVRDANIRTIYNPIDINKIRKEAKQKISGVVKPYILFVGRFEPQKRHDRMIEVYAKSGLQNEYDLVFCGVGSLESEMKEYAKKLGVSRHTHFLGWQENVYKWMGHAEMLLCTSDFEGFPMNLIEAFACGTKVVSADCEYGPNEILKGDFSKYLVEKSNIDAYIRAIKLAEKAYPRYENPIIRECSIEVVIEQYEDFYNEK